MPELFFRAAVRADLARLKEIDGRAFGAGEQYDDDTYASFLSQPHLRTILACVPEDRIVGYALLEGARDPARLRSIAIDPAYCRRGYGQALLIESMNRAEGDVELLVERDNTAAIRLYERAGLYFVPSSGELPDRLRMIRKKTGMA